MNKPKIWVVCPDYTSGPHGSREIAQRHIDHVEALGACQYEHEIIERVVKPVPANQSLAWAEDPEPM